ncbi:MAG: 50S ribosomal protein L40e [Crenarchaeota archaeon]|nr:50S ribosomal protein L40e [Thermoproteota archaeon]MCR8453425.1 50S ribosomal protein L40e [Thermoproteota archaeon]MCR8454930.1 50S ribosomal protein L40e [Thermoproteota archaeon]MCR8463157.1 50S ribosomal protein L40e [Thermoproteota archaeon]MCR8470489.1 50S ribosomal protein L40e [Thermoproteota archaeon]
MRLQDPIATEVVVNRVLGYKVCRRCNSRNSIVATQCRRCKSKQLRLKKIKVGKK